MYFINNAPEGALRFHYLSPAFLRLETKKEPPTSHIITWGEAALRGMT